MLAKALVRWIFFACYVAFFFVFPLSVLWNLTGLLIGLSLTFFLLFWISYRGSERIATSLSVKPLAPIEEPKLFALVVEHCRRLNLQPPRLGLIESTALNTAVFGFSEKKRWLVVTRGLIDNLSREKLSAVVARQISVLWYRDLFCDTWLTQFLSFLEMLAGEPWKSASQRHLSMKRGHTLRHFIRQVLLYPLGIFPSLVLRRRIPNAEIDERAVRIGRHPRAYSEALRMIEAEKQRIPFPVPFATRHLFLVPPSTHDAFARAFFKSEPLMNRIGQIEKLYTLVHPS